MGSMTRSRDEGRSSWSFDMRIWYIALTLAFLGVIVRILLYDTVTSDYIYFVSKWFYALQTLPGLSAFRSPFSDYSPAYLYLIKLVTYLPISSLYSTKTISVLCDVIIAIYVSRIWGFWSTNKAERFFVGVIAFILPTVLVNGALWGQSDSVYAAGVVAALYYMLADRPLASAVAFGIALSIKLQAIFFLPVMAGYLLYKKEYYRYFVVIPLLYILSIVPAWLGGGSFVFWLLSYSRQSGTYTDLSVSAPSLYAFVMGYPLTSDAKQVLLYLGIIVAVIIAFGVMWYIRFLYKTQSTQREIVLVSLLCVLTLPLVLPRMHERYFYLADIFSFIYVLYDPRRWYVAAGVSLASLISYVPFLSKQPTLFEGLSVDLRIPAFMFVVLVIILVRDLLHLRGTKKTPADTLSAGAPRTRSRTTDLRYRKP